MGTALRGKIALVTGAGRGIGRATAERLAAEGAVVAVNYARDEAAAGKTVEAIVARGGRAFPVRAELGVPAGVDELFAAFDRELGAEAPLDILVNNAGISMHAPIEQVTPDMYDRGFAVNTRAAFFVTQRALPRIPDGGRIVIVTSGVTRIAFPEGIAYAMTKGALETFTLTLAKHLGPRGITVNNVAPGIVDTDTNAAWLRGNAEAWRASAARAALGRVGAPEDVADVVAFLASGDARWVTGTTVDATGGSHL
ncbi:short-chain dehydrogenase [Planotetraspora thailandica]|uniref:Short-chain dehydrogenase n=1 Tax=Planotetraspora thailandica TaxID=487172 RepID=A0A8J3Y138_9ACTN|nr:SDR family oxidoreductase [Planotetraspora thailandica]GII58928.1 short-chain dehydrogenase [Planotetraspora thailandica]